MPVVGRIHSAVATALNTPGAGGGFLRRTYPVLNYMNSPNQATYFIKPRESSSEYKELYIMESHACNHTDLMNTCIIAKNAFIHMLGGKI